MQPRLPAWIACAAVLFSSCGPGPAGPPGSLTVAAAANLSEVFAEAGRKFREQTGIDATFSYGSTAQLAQQIENGAPFDVFAAADTGHVDSLVKSGKALAGSRAVYALGQLVLWMPRGEESGVRNLAGLRGGHVRFVAIAQPDLAPYGEASVEALRNAGLWEAIQPKVVYANNISQARQLAASGNADAAFTAHSLVLHDQGSVLSVDPSLYRPIEQAVAIIAGSRRQAEAQKFREFLLGTEGRRILAASGYTLP